MSPLAPLGRWVFVDADGATKTTFSYTGFGQTTLSGELFPYAFTGRRYLYELGLYDYRSRFYYPWLSRFLQRDPIGIWGDGVGLGNGYAYVGNNPVSRVDPFGLQGGGGAESIPEPRGRKGGPGLSRMPLTGIANVLRPATRRRHGDALSWGEVPGQVYDRAAGALGDHSRSYFGVAVRHFAQKRRRS